MLHTTPFLLISIFTLIVFCAIFEIALKKLKSLEEDILSKDLIINSLRNYLKDCENKLNTQTDFEETIKDLKAKLAEKEINNSVYSTVEQLSTDKDSINSVNSSNTRLPTNSKIKRSYKKKNGE
jgi:uncharacterized membrane protein